MLTAQCSRSGCIHQQGRGFDGQGRMGLICSRHGVASGKSAKCDIAIGRATRFTGRLTTAGCGIPGSRCGMAAVQGETLIDAHEHRLTASGETSVLIMQWLRQQFPASKQPRQGFQNPDGAQDAVKRVLQCQVPLADFCTRGAQGQGSQSGAKSGGAPGTPEDSQWFVDPRRVFSGCQKRRD